MTMMLHQKMSRQHLDGDRHRKVVGVGSIRIICAMKKGLAKLRGSILPRPLALSSNYLAIAQTGSCTVNRHVLFASI